MRARPFGATKVHPMVRFSPSLSSEKKKRLALPAKKEFEFSHCVTRLPPLSCAGLHSAPCVLCRKNFD